MKHIIGPIKHGKAQKHVVFQILYSIAFLLAISAAINGYVNSAYLQEFFPDAWVGFIFTIAYAVSFVCVILFPRFINAVGRGQAFIIMLIAQLLGLAVLAFVPLGVAAFLGFIMLIAGSNLLLILYDLLIEHFTAPRDTGRVRGGSLTIMNLGWLVSPLIAGILLERFGFSAIYMFSGLSLLPIFILLGFAKDGKVSYIRPKKSTAIIKKVLKSVPLRSAFVSVFLLQFFYAWMVIYTPLYLLDLGFAWDTIGEMFTFMLLPFVLLQFPAGYLADKFWGEREMMTVAFIIMAIATASIFWTTGVVAIAIALFCTRIGAALVEELSDSYFFKHVHERDVTLINYYRNMRPLAYIVAPLLASLLLVVIDVKALFLVLGAVVVCGTYFTLTMPDTK